MVAQVVWYAVCYCAVFPILEAVDFASRVPGVLYVKLVANGFQWKPL
jgi:hypothetical protein